MLVAAMKALQFGIYAKLFTGGRNSAYSRGFIRLKFYILGRHTIFLHLHLGSETCTLGICRADTSRWIKLGQRISICHYWVGGSAEICM